MAAKGLVNRRAHVPEVGGRPQMAILFALFKRIPVASALLITSFDIEFVLLIRMVVKTAEGEPQPGPLAWLVIALLAAGTLTVLGWWQIAGFNRPGKWRNLRLFWPPALVGLLVPVWSGVQLPAPAPAAFLLAVSILVAFREEALYRGIILHILNPGGRRRAVFLSALLFGVSSTAVVLLFDPAGPLLPRVAVSLGLGVALGALRLRTNTLWISLLLNVLIGMALRFAPWQSAYLNVVLPTLLLGYGIFLLRDRRALEPEGLPVVSAPGDPPPDRRSMRM